MTDRLDTDADTGDLYGDRPHSAAEYAARRRERQAERVHRVRRARTRRLRSGAAGLIALVIIPIAAWLVVAGFAQIGAVTRAEQLLDDADRIVAQVDTSVSGQDRAAGAERARGIAERIPGAHELLEKAAVELERAKPPLTWIWPRPKWLAEAIDARTAMLVPAPQLLEISAQSSSASPLADTGWEAIERARAETSATVPPKSGASEKKLAAAVAAADSVAGDLSLAQQRFSAAQRAFPEASFDSYLNYVTLLQQANRAARQASKALAEGRELTAATALKTRESKAKKAAETRRKLSLPVEKAVDAGVAKAAGERLKIYDAARERAVKADERLRRQKLKAQESP